LRKGRESKEEDEKCLFYAFLPNINSKGSRATQNPLLNASAFPELSSANPDSALPREHHRWSMVEMFVRAVKKRRGFEDKQV